MKKTFTTSLALASGLTLGACRPVSESNSIAKSLTDESNPASFSETPSEVFGLASFVQRSDKLKSFHPYVGPGAAYLFFGETDKFRVETNLSVEARGGSAIVGGGDRYIRSAYFLDAFAFGRPLANGDAVDIEARADLNAMKLILNVRALGNTLYSHEVTTGYEQSFTRDFEYKQSASGSSLGIPIPGLGLTITGKIGGEIGLKAAPGLRGDSAISAGFEPNVILHGSVAGGLSAFNFLSVEALGSAKLMDFRVSGSANLGYSPFNNFIYGDAGFDGGTVEALDGKIDLIAKADLGGALPAGVSPLLWTLLGTTVEAKTWEHTLWDPLVVYATEIPGQGQSFIKYFVATKDCATSVANTLTNLKGRMARLEGQKATFVGQEAVVLKSSIKSLQSVMTQVEGFCAKDSLSGSDQRMHD